MLRIFLVCMLAMFFAACDDKKIAISDGDNGDTKALDSLVENIDSKSYEGLENVFSSTNDIKANDRPMMIVFGKNNCPYCEKLKEYIKQNKEVSDELHDKFTSYYINTSYSKNHNVEYLNKTIATDTFASMYDLSGTPLIVFLEPDGTEIIRTTGFRDDIFSVALNFVSTGRYKDAEDKESRGKLFSQDFQDYLKKSKS